MNNTILKLYYNLRKNIYLNIEYYKIIETLPLGYNSRSIVISITLLLAVFSTFLLFSKVIYIFEGTIYYQNILNTIFTFFIINIIFIKFNFIVKIYYFIFIFNINTIKLAKTLTLKKNKQIRLYN